MTELAALNVRISGDASGLRGALQSAEAGLERVSTQATATQRQVAATSGGMSRLGQVFQRNGFAISNAANQFSDLAVQMQMGVPASRALSQQLPQMTAFMGPLVSILGVAAGVLIGFAGNLLMSSDNANTLTTSLEALDRIQSDLNTANEILNLSVAELTVRYGEYAGAVLEAARSMAILAEAEAQQRMGEALADVDSALRGLTSSGRTFDTAMTTALSNIRERFGVTSSEAQRLNDLFQQLETATTFDQQVEALRLIEQFMADTGASASDLPPELISALQQLNQMVLASADLAVGLDNAATSGANLTRALGQTTGGSLAGMSGASVLPPMGGEGEGGGRAAGGGGRQQVNPLIGQLESLEQSLLTAEELQVQSYQRQQETLEQALNQRLLTQQEYARMMEQVEQSHQFAMVQAANDGARQTLSNLATVFQGSKEISAGIALANSWLAFTEVLKDPSFIGRPFARIAAAGAALSSGLQAVRNIKSASRGGVSGGANSAAMAGPAMSAGGGGGTSSNVAIQLTGGDIFSRDQVIQLINKINEAQEDGAVVRLV
jgi:hypothetical protein